MRVKELKLWDDREDVILTGYINKPDSIALNKAKRPAVLILPGGAYNTCERQSTEGDSVALKFAADGFQSFVLQYSVIMTAPEGKTLFPAQLLDVAKAVIAIKENAEKWYIDPDKIIIAGFSAGAHLASLYATTWQQPLFAETFGEESEYFKPAVGIFMYGFYDYEFALAKYINDPNYDVANGNPHPVLVSQKALFGTATPDLALMDKYSPLKQVSENCPPSFLCAALDDVMVNPVNSLMMTRKLKEAGVKCELHMFSMGGHGFGTGNNLEEPWGLEKSMNCSKWYALARNFIMSAFAPETAEKDRDLFMLRMKKFSEKMEKSSD